MDRRLELHEELVNRLGSRNVYYQSPESVKMSYPAIRYSLNDIFRQDADNQIYNSIRSYEVTLIDPDPDSPVVEKLINMSMCRFTRQYVADNLNHFVFSLYY